jgi:cytochrome c553
MAWADIAAATTPADAGRVLVDPNHPDYLKFRLKWAASKGHGKSVAPTCRNCHGPHPTAKCPIPSDYDGNYRLDSKGSSGCSCKE